MPPIFRVKFPDGIYEIPEHNLDQAISLGGEPIDDNLIKNSVDTRGMNGTNSGTNLTPSNNNNNMASAPIDGMPPPMAPTEQPAEIRNENQHSEERLYLLQFPDGQYEIPERNLAKAKQLGGKIVKGIVPLSASSSEEPDSLGKTLARTAKSVAAGATGGLVDAATSIYNIPASIANAANAANKDNPFEIDPISGMPVPNNSGNLSELPLIPSATEAIKEKIDEATGGYTETPKGAESTQKAFETAAAIASPGGLARAATNIGAKGASKVLGAIGSTKPTSLAAAGAAGGATQEASELGYGTVASMGAGLGTGALTGGALGVAKAFNTKIALAKLTGNSPKNINLEAVKAAEEAGLDYPNTLVNEGKGIALAEQIVAKSPYFGTKYNRKLSNIDKKYSDKVNRSIEKVGARIVEEGDALDIGSQVKETFGNVKQSIIDEKNDLYVNSNSFLPNGATYTPKNLANAVQELRDRVKTLRASTDESYILKYLDDVEPGLFVGSGKDKIAVPVPVNMLVGTKKSLNDIINWDVNASGAKKQLKNLQTALKKDLKEYGETNQEWYKIFSEAEEFYGHYLGDKALGSDTVKKILSQQNPEKIITNLKDVSDFRNLEQALGRTEAGQKFFDSIKREKLTDIIMGKAFDNKTGNVTYLPFTKAIETPATKQLVKYLAGENYQEIVNFKKYAEAAVRRNQRNPNASGTGPTNAIIAGFVGAAAESGGIIKKAKDFAKLAVAGAGLSWLVNNKKVLSWGIEGAKKQAAGNYKDANILGKRIERTMTEDLGEDFVRQFIALS